MASFRNALFLFAFVVVVVEVYSASFQQSDYEQRSSDWSAQMSPHDMLKLWKKDENTSGVNSVKGCCVSNTWSATMFTEFVNSEGRQEIVRCKNVMNVDPATKRWADDSTVNNGLTISQIILCDKSGYTHFNFSKTEKWCKATQEAGDCPIRPANWCFPSNGTLTGSFSFGAGPGALKTQLWNYLTRDDRGETLLDVLLAPDDCVPILTSWTTKDTLRNQASVVASLFANFSVSIPDPSVFIPPSYCHGKEDEDGDTLTFDRPESDINAIFK